MRLNQQFCFKMGLNSLQLIVVSLLICYINGQKPNDSKPFCEETSPLDTRFFVPFFESHVPVVGCSSREKALAPPGYHVHVIRLNTTSTEVIIHYNENNPSSKGLILVLDSPTAIRWRLAFVGNYNSSYKRLVYLSSGSTVFTTNLKITTQGSTDQLLVNSGTPDAEFAVRIKEEWGGLTTFSSIVGANRISILLAKRESLSPQCSIDGKTTSEYDSPIFAYHTVKQTMSGCYHPEAAGVGSSDVHVIDLSTADPLQAVEAAQNVDNGMLLPAVYISLSPDQRTSSTIEDRYRNLTLILKSQMPVKWYLESEGLSGNLEVISNNGPVENHSLSSGQHLKIIRKSLPLDFEGLWKSVVAETGSTPVSYVKVKVANVMAIVIPPRYKRGLDEIPSIDAPANLVPDATNLFGSESTRGTSPPEGTIGEIDKHSRLSEIESILNRRLVKNCTNDQFIIVTLPRSTTDFYNITNIRFSDERCRGVKNSTHWILKSRSTSCGSINAFSRDQPMVETSIFAEFSSESEFQGARLRFKVVCRFPAGLFGMSFNSKDDDDDDDDDNLVPILDDDDDDENEEKKFSDNSKSNDLYTVRLYRTDPLPELILTERSEDSVTVSVGDRILVETHFDAKAFIGLAVEKCWLTDGNDVHSGLDRTEGDSARWLVWRNCPTNSNITFEDKGMYPAFSFTITQDHHRLKQFYLACQVGLCFKNQKLSGINLELCYDQKECYKPNPAQHEPSVAQQIIKRGPIFVKDTADLQEIHDDGTFYPPPSTIGIHDSLSQRSNVVQTPVMKESPSLHSSHSVMVGVSAEIAVVIALASFVIGAALTGLLCCVHHRRAMPKGNNYHIRVGSPHDPAEGSELQSMIGSPSLHPQQPNGTIT